jgi:regulatory protein
MGDGAAPLPPPIITALEPDAHRPGSLRVRVNGEIYCTIPAEAAAGLAPGQRLESDVVHRLSRAADLEAAYRTVLRALERRSYARGELGRRLVRRGHPKEAVGAALDRAAEAGLIDDAAFARSYVETRAARGRGPARLIRDLLAMGVERGLIDRALAEQWPEGMDPSAVPQALVAKRSAQLGDLAKPVKRRRLLAYLARRGFTGREALEAVRRAVG